MVKKYSVLKIENSNYEDSNNRTLILCFEFLLKFLDGGFEFLIRIDQIRNGLYGVNYRTVVATAEVVPD